MKDIRYIKTRKQAGFTLMELMIVVAIIGVLSAIAYPTYQNSVMKAKRADTMSAISDIAKQIESSKLAKGKYSEVVTTSYVGDYPKSGNALYTVTISSPLAASWTITATPKTGGTTDGDGALTYNYQNKKCRNISTSDKRCGYGQEWNE